MRAAQINTVLQEIKCIFAAAGAGTAEKDLELLAEYFEQQGDRDLDEVLAGLRSRLDPVAAKSASVALHSESLKDAGLDESRFRSAFAKLKGDKVLDNDDLLKVLRSYGVIRISGKSRNSYLESLEKHFYWLLYNRDADTMAKRATPW